MAIAVVEETRAFERRVALVAAARLPRFLPMSMTAPGTVRPATVLGRAVVRRQRRGRQNRARRSLSALRRPRR